MMGRILIVMFVMMSYGYGGVRLGELCCGYRYRCWDLFEIRMLNVRCERWILDCDLLVERFNVERRRFDRYSYEEESEMKERGSDVIAGPSSGTWPRPASSRDSFLTRASSRIPPQHVRMDFHRTRRS